MSDNRALLEAEFMYLCRTHGPRWVESVIRPLRLPGASITVRDIPTVALVAVVCMFGRVQRLVPNASIR